MLGVIMLFSHLRLRSSILYVPLISGVKHMPGSKGARHSPIINRASLISIQAAGIGPLRCHGTNAVGEVASEAVSINASEQNKASLSHGKSSRRAIIIKAKRWEQRSSHPSETEQCHPDGDVITKTIHFQRHGQGYHNLLWRAYHDLGLTIDLNITDPKLNPFVRSEIVDSPLTSKGIGQCEDQRELANNICRDVQLIVVSPLSRAMQTAHITFADYRSGVQWMAHDGCREELGLLTCNKRRKLSQLREEYPYVDSTFVHQAELDELWFPHERESTENQSDRIYQFLTEFVRNRKETDIAVIGHSAWLSTMTNHVMEMCAEDDNEAEHAKLKSWFEVSEIRSMQVSFHTSDM